jgi:cytochrome c oxidase accessory protein FixG
LTPEQPQIPPSLDEFGERKWIIPAEVKGYFRKRRTLFHLVLLGVFLLTPWFNINGRQALLLDIANREFHFFGLSLFAHDAPLLFLLMAMGVFGLIFVTTVWGRVFCGWACPQTVFIDAVFRRIEILVEGKYLQRRKESLGPLTQKIIFKKILKWILFLIASSLIAHSFMAFFVGSKSLIAMMQGNPRENWTYFVWITAITLIVLFDFAWFREQFCLIMCPYGRFQSVLLEKKTINIAYDVQRGEPRKGMVPTGSAQGDCVSCRRCVEVCPTAIDIRQGLQMECIACTACIDACDEIMEKVNKPKGLIRYMNTYGNAEWSARSPRALFSLGIVLGAFCILTGVLLSRKDVDLSVLRAKDALFQEVTENNVVSLTNHFKLHIHSQSSQPLNLKIKSFADGQPLEVITPVNPVEIAVNDDREIHVFIKFPPSLLKNGQTTAMVVLENSETHQLVVEKYVHLVGPGTP